MGLNVRAELGFDCDVGLFEPGVNVAAAIDRRAVDVAVLRGDFLDHLRHPRSLADSAGPG